jgi:argininosuccinate lyase
MLEAAAGGYMDATALADCLAGRGVELCGLSLAEFEALHPLFGPGIHQVLGPAAGVASRRSPMGTGQKSVETQLELAEKLLAETPCAGWRSEEPRRAIRG